MSKLNILIQAIWVLKNWPIYLADYLRMVHHPTVVYKLRNGVLCAIRSKTNDRVIFNQIWLERVYVPPGFEIKNHDIVVDIGAHIGLFSIFAATRAKHGRVYAFEPAPDNFEMLRRNISLNKISNIIPANRAVSGKSGQREFILYKESAAAHSFIFAYNTLPLAARTLSKGENNPERVPIRQLAERDDEGLPTEKRDIITVQTVSLDEIVQKNKIETIDFLKMDCEGAEYEILFNASPQTLAMIKKIGMEYHEDDDRNVNKLKIFLEKNGFRVSTKSHRDNMLYATR